MHFRVPGQDTCKTAADNDDDFDVAVGACDGNDDDDDRDAIPLLEHEEAEGGEDESEAAKEVAADLIVGTTPSPDFADNKEIGELPT